MLIYYYLCINLPVLIHNRHHTHTHTHTHIHNTYIPACEEDSEVGKDGKDGRIGANSGCDVAANREN